MVAGVEDAVASGTALIHDPEVGGQVHVPRCRGQVETNCRFMDEKNYLAEVEEQPVRWESDSEM